MSQHDALYIEKFQPKENKMSGPSYDPSDGVPPCVYAEDGREDQKGYPKKVKIVCPDCSFVLDAEIHFYKGDPFETFLHTCSSCGCEIGEDEWTEVEVKK